MSSVPEVLVTQSSDLKPRKLPLSGAASAGLRLLGSLLAHLPRLDREDEPGPAVLRDLGLDHERRQGRFDIADTHQGLGSRVRSLDASQGWRGS